MGAVDSVIDADGNFYITDNYNHRIVKYDETGTLVRAYGSFGSGAGEFNRPQNIAIGADGAIYVADSFNNRIVKFADTNDDGVIDVWEAWGSAGSGVLEFNKPYSVAVAGSIIYVADSFNSRIAKFDSAVDPSEVGETWVAFGTRGTEDGQFRNIYDITVDAQGDVWATDPLNNRVARFTADGTFVANYAANLPYGVASDANGNVYVAERLTGVIKCVNNTSSLAWPAESYAGKGTLDNQFSNPVGLNIDQHGRLWVVDVTTSKVQRGYTSVL